ncbi:MAG: rhodanese-related sulfurtransferase [Candidatus Azotimanducaceae bacterium]|jgi:rhodanese-related sulfurtransferase
MKNIPMKNMPMKKKPIKLAAIVMAAYLLMHGPLSLAQTALARVERSIAEGSQIVQMSSDAVLDLLDDKAGTVLLFDVREQDEFAVSHLPGAIRLAPDVSIDQFYENYGTRLKGVMPIFYCSVGRRSNALAEAVAAHGRLNTKHQPITPTNLRGGIFRWHNETKPLVNVQGATDQVHPYNGLWRRMLEHPDRSAYAPAASAAPLP